MYDPAVAVASSVPVKLIDTVSVPALARDAGKEIPALAPVTTGVAVDDVRPSPLGDVVSVVEPKERVNTPGSLFRTAMVPSVPAVMAVPEMLTVPTEAELKEQDDATVPLKITLPSTANADVDSTASKATKIYFIFTSSLYAS